MRGAYTVADMNQLAQLIHAAGLTQGQVADKLGVTQATVSRKVAGKSGWSVLEVTQLAMLLGVDRATVLAAVVDEMGGAA